MTSARDVVDATHHRTDSAPPSDVLGCIAATLAPHHDGCTAVLLMPLGDAIPRVQTIEKVFKL